MNNLSKEKKQQLLVVALITVVLSVGIWYGLISSQQKQIAAMRKKTGDLQQKVDSAQRLIKQGMIIEEEMVDLQAEIAAREESMASGDLYQWFMSKMIPATAGTRLGGFSANPPALGETRLLPKFPYRSATYSVRLNGHYHEFGKFIAAIENEFPYGRIQNLDITAPPAQTEERLNFTFEFVTLYHTNRAVSTR
ncbi:MAG: hypothetical protein ACK4UN_06530 [Limisphaerales bacterium]